jgi:hypothetical protein
MSGLPTGGSDEARLTVVQGQMIIPACRTARSSTSDVLRIIEDVPEQPVTPHDG